MTEVKTDIYVTSFGPVSDTDMVSVILGIIHMNYCDTAFSKIHSACFIYEDKVFHYLCNCFDISLCLTIYCILIYS